MNRPFIIDKVETSEKVIAFTFDDGPHPVYTAELLAIFRETAGKATFFMIGEQIEANRAIAEAVYAQGHELANHTYSHPYLTKLTRAEAADELNKTEQLIRSITHEAVQCFRPPYLDMNDDIASIAEEAGYTTIGALNLDARDWEEPGVAHIVRTTRAYAANGSILLFHDGYGDRSQTVEAVRTLVRELAADGYRLVTVRELLEKRRFEDG
ncbi:polysaccharide deacetylase [Paenibacillus curdlanolyticus YK9]|uniref:Polysaccharide deacetylase n=1 Tax=Paenibacillus curdlanolyticus YK9 TaxID=717606 RepID=E0IFB4_9BACL|nr:polysaccharide deacetylase family protein [Paenibacillus curdlanolyticus]EFM08890.1 polysaccharide deacetylase [Paenibacillus curdlanolyticus YK9]